MGEEKRLPIKDKGTTLLEALIFEWWQPRLPPRGSCNQISGPIAPSTGKDRERRVDAEKSLLHTFDEVHGRVHFVLRVCIQILCREFDMLAKFACRLQCPNCVRNSRERSAHEDYFKRVWFRKG